MKIIKDLLYNKGNVNLDIARVSAALSTLAFLGLAIAKFVLNKDIDLIEFGTAWGLICAGSGGFIYARQKYEGEA